MKKNLVSPPVLAVLAAALLLLIWKLATPIFIIFGAVLFAVVGTAAIEFIQKKFRIHRGFSFGIFIFLLAGLMTLAIYLFVEPLASQSQSLFSNIDNVTMQFQNEIQDSISFLPDDVVRSTVVSFFDNGGFSASAIYQSSVVQSIIALAFIILISLFFMYSPFEYVKSLKKLSGNSARFSKALGTARKDLRWWSVGRLSSMIVVSILTWIGLLILGVPYALSLAVIAGLLSFIPNFGPILSVAPAVVIAIPFGLSLVLKVLVLYVIVQLIESNFITPFIQRKAVSLPPAYLIIAQIAFGLLFGFLGLLFAVPITLTARAFVKEYWKR